MYFRPQIAPEAIKNGAATHHSDHVVLFVWPESQTSIHIFSRHATSPSGIQNGRLLATTRTVDNAPYVAL